MHDDLAATAGLLQGQNRCFSHPGVDVLTNLSFTLHSDLTLVQGGDGCGKTTLLRLMAGLRLAGRVDLGD